MSLTGNCDSTQYCSHSDRSRENFAGTRKNIDGHAVSPELNTSKGGADKKVAGVDKVVRALTCGFISICVTERATCNLSGLLFQRAIPLRGGFIIGFLKEWKFLASKISPKYRHENDKDINVLLARGASPVPKSTNEALQHVAQRR
ncbi:hypothetical protein [Stutzerimonas nitrititolerans]|uniref:hypothetical protein n=1 Tax=Stutzerimonas nitrititolerans TaxID=2482751 RepID=UPI0028AEB08F|nr:hypothetical protein [Stutzerimonas nitrititolerans]